MENKSYKVNKTSFKDGILWLYVDLNNYENIQFEIKYLDIDNRYSPTAWQQILKSEIVEAVYLEKCIGLRIKDIHLTSSCAGIEIRIVKEGVCYDLELSNKDVNIPLCFLGVSRGTLYLAQKRQEYDLDDANVFIEEKSLYDKISIQKIAKIDGYEICGFFIRKRYSLISNFGSVKHLKFDKKTEDIYVIEIPQDEFDNNYNNKYTYDFYVEYEHKEYGYRIETPLMIRDIGELIFKNDKLSKKYYRTKDGKLAVYIFKGEIETNNLIEDNSKRIKIAAWGSCYLRNMFSKTYNPNWKNMFNVVDSYFWFSAISCMSLEGGKNLYERFLIKSSERNKINLEREFNKKAFDFLEKSNADYILLDFYADAMSGVRQITKDCYVGQGVAFSPDMQFKEEYENLIQTKYPKIDYRVDGYWDLWCEYCNHFVRKLKEYGFEKKIILVIGSFALEFIDSKKKVTSYKEIKENGRYIDINNLRARKALWDKMNDYFISLVPDVKKLDMRDYGYLGDMENQFVGPNHFEHNYYRSEMAELCKVILKDKINT